MSIEFSAESLYVARNWDTVAEIVEAAQRLRSNMAESLKSLQADLKTREWWSDEWVYLSWDSTQWYITRHGWLSGPYHLVWIGVKGFSPDGVFGLGEPPELFVWVSQKQFALATALAASLEGREGPGEIDQKPGNGYVVRQAVAKCLPDAVEDYFTRAREQLLAFFDHYAAMADLWDPIVRRHVSE